MWLRETFVCYFYKNVIYIIYKKSSSVPVLHSDLVDVLFVGSESRMPPFAIRINPYFFNFSNFKMEQFLWIVFLFPNQVVSMKMMVFCQMLWFVVFFYLPVTQHHTRLPTFINDTKLFRNEWEWQYFSFFFSKCKVESSDGRYLKEKWINCVGKRSGYSGAGMYPPGTGFHWILSWHLPPTE